MEVSKIVRGVPVSRTQSSSRNPRGPWTRALSQTTPSAGSNRSVHMVFDHVDATTFLPGPVDSGELEVLLPLEQRVVVRVMGVDHTRGDPMQIPWLRVHETHPLVRIALHDLVPGQSFIHGSVLPLQHLIIFGP